MTRCRRLALGDAFGETRFRITAGQAEQRLADREVPPGPKAIDATTAAPDALARAFACAYRADPYRGYGGSMRDVLRRVGAGEDWRAVTAGQFRGMGSSGKGAAMQFDPLGAWFAADLELAARQAVLSAEVTHAHPEAAAGAQVRLGHRDAARGACVMSAAYVCAGLPEVATALSVLVGGPRPSPRKDPARTATRYSFPLWQAFRNNGSQNPIAYCELAEEAQFRVRECACGCGETGERDFLPARDPRDPGPHPRSLRRLAAEVHPVARHPGRRRRTARCNSPDCPVTGARAG